MRNLACVILAAGEGTRMKSRLPKVLHDVCGVPMLGQVMDVVESLGIRNVTVVAGRGIGLIKEYVGRRAAVVEQKQRKGSGHALMQTRRRLGSFGGGILVLYGDTPLLTRETLSGLIGEFGRIHAQSVLLTALLENPAGYGRIVRNGGGSVARIVEEMSATPAEKAIREINVGAYCFRKSVFEALASLKPDPVKKEYYLTDAVEKLAQKGDVRTYRGSRVEGRGINSREDLASAEGAMKDRILKRLMSRGVTIKDPATTWIDSKVQIGQDTVIYPNTVIEGPCKIGRDCRVGPFARIRPGVTLEDGAEIGNFVEIVRSRIGKKTLVKHLTYLGDATVGSGVNIGAGTITANFDGRRKHATVIGDRAQIGSGTVLVAPVKIGKGAKTGAGAVVTRGRNVAAGETVVGVPAKPLNRGKGQGARGK